VLQTRHSFSLTSHYSTVHLLWSNCPMTYRVNRTGQVFVWNQQPGGVTVYPRWETDSCSETRELNIKTLPYDLSIWLQIWWCQELLSLMCFFRQYWDRRL
jgi:hypothetical protein